MVDARMKVFGLEGLRIVDASVMPTITSATTNSPTMMIAGARRVHPGRCGLNRRADHCVIQCRPAARGRSRVDKREKMRRHIGLCALGLMPAWRRLPESGAERDGTGGMNSPLAPHDFRPT